MTTWNPSDSSSSIVLSSGNLVATLNLFNSSWRGVRSTTNKTSGKWYVKATIAGDVGNSGSGNWSLGLSNATTNLDFPSVYPAIDTNSATYFPFSGQWGYNNSFNADFGTAADGDNIGLAFDMSGAPSSSHVQINKNGGSWTSHTESFPTTVYLMFAATSTNSGSPPQITIDFTASGYAAPDGTYSAWDASGPSSTAVTRDFGMAVEPDRTQREPVSRVQKWRREAADLWNRRSSGLFVPRGFYPQLV